MKKLTYKQVSFIAILSLILTFNVQASSKKTPPQTGTAKTAPVDGGWFQPFWDLFNW